MRERSERRLVVFSEYCGMGSPCSSTCAWGGLGHCCATRFAAFESVCSLNAPTWRFRSGTRTTHVLRETGEGKGREGKGSTVFFFLSSRKIETLKTDACLLPWKVAGLGREVVLEVGSGSGSGSGLVGFGWGKGSSRGFLLGVACGARY